LVPRVDEDREKIAHPQFIAVVVQDGQPLRGEAAEDQHGAVLDCDTGFVRPVAMIGNSLSANLPAAGEPGGLVEDLVSATRINRLRAHRQDRENLNFSRSCDPKRSRSSRLPGQEDRQAFAIICT
jgi:hypothetical protein